MFIVLWKFAGEPTKRGALPYLGPDGWQLKYTPACLFDSQRAAEEAIRHHVGPVNRRHVRVYEVTWIVRWYYGEKPDRIDSYFNGGRPLWVETLKKATRFTTLGAAQKARADRNWNRLERTGDPDVPSFGARVHRVLTRVA